ncbi:hypothetical protein OAS47_04460 [Pelagibacteraceae bacterium]|nr:hypothetical protein [Pelagibacteraceae bacterium]
MEENNYIKEFKVFGYPMESVSIFYGIFLISWGIAISLVTSSTSLTSFIPSYLGLPILIFAILSVRFKEKKKLFMHIVVTFGLLVFIGGLDIIRAFLKANLFENLYADLSKFMMLITGLVFTFLCIKSFIFARKNR